MYTAGGASELAHHCPAAIEATAGRGSGRCASTGGAATGAPRPGTSPATATSRSRPSAPSRRRRGATVRSPARSASPRRPPCMTPRVGPPCMRHRRVRHQFPRPRWNRCPTCLPRTRQAPDRARCRCSQRCRRRRRSGHRRAGLRLVRHQVEPVLDGIRPACSPTWRSARAATSSRATASSASPRPLVSTRFSTPMRRSSAPTSRADVVRHRAGARCARWVTRSAGVASRWTDADTSGDPDTPVTTVVGSTDPCAARRRIRWLRWRRRGAGATAAATEPAPPTTVPCKVQPDGSEICEFECVGATIGTGPATATTTLECPAPPCPQPVPGQAPSVGVPEDVDCPPPDPGVRPIPLPEPRPTEIVLVDAEPSLVLLPATDGSSDALSCPRLPLHRRGRRHGGSARRRRRCAHRPEHHRDDDPDTIEPDPMPVRSRSRARPSRRATPSGTTHTVAALPHAVRCFGAHHVDAFA